jgi:hypothetical protein
LNVNAQGAILFHNVTVLNSKDMRRLYQLLHEPPDWKVAEDIKNRIVYVRHLNNLSILTLWTMFIGGYPQTTESRFYDVANNIDNFHLWLNAEF